MSDLIARLRHWQENCNDEYMHELAGRAADCIAELEERLDAVKKIVEVRSDGVALEVWQALGGDDD